MATKDISDRQVCEAVRESRLHGFYPWPCELLAQRTGQPEKVCCRAIERAEEHGLLEYGVSLRTAWLTEQGMDLIAATGGEGDAG